MMGFGGWVVTE